MKNCLKKSKKKIETKYLTVPLYLNQNIVFDLLATIEDGFSTIKKN